MARTIHDAHSMDELLDGCGSGSAMGYYVKGHVSKLDLLCAVVYTGYWVNGRNLDVRREWWRDVPASIYDPEWEPCETGEEPMVFDNCRPDAPGAYPVTVVYR